MPTPETKNIEKLAALRKNIFFRIGSAQLPTSEQEKVAELAEFLKANSDAKVEIHRLCRCRYGIEGLQPEAFETAGSKRCGSVGESER